MTRVSIVTISFNQARFLEEAIRSVITQDYPDVEYIVVDPGSTDGSRDIIERYRPQIAKVILDPDRGPADGLNRGFAEATGDAIGFINADDFLLPGALRHVAEFFEANPKCDLLMGNGYIVNADRGVRRHVTARDFTFRRALYGGTRWLQQSTFVSRKAFRRTSGFNINTRTVWDYDLFLSIVKQESVVGYTNADLACFRIHDESISGTGRLADVHRKECMRLFRESKGRDWRVTDEALRFLYRCEGLLLRFWNESRASHKKGEFV